MRKVNNQKEIDEIKKRRDGKGRKKQISLPFV